MVANKLNGKSEEPLFTIEDNVLKGRVKSFSKEFVSVGKVALEKLKSAPDLIGQVDVKTGKEDTFSAMRERSVKCALWLKQQGIQTTDIVSLSTHNHLDSFAPFLATLYIGAIFNSWDNNMNLATARHFLITTRPKVIFANKQSAPVVVEAAKLENHDFKVVVFGDHPGTVSFSSILEGHDKAEVEDFQCVDVKDYQKTAGVLFSSGTTGLPKGVQLSHLAMFHHLKLQESMNLTDIVPLWFSTLYWISGILLTVQAITSLNTRILYPSFDEEITCKLIEKFKVSWMFLSSSMTNRLLKSGFIQKYDLSSLKILCLGGANFTAEAQQELTRTLPNMLSIQAYGMTELGAVTSCQTKDYHKPGSCGVPACNVEIKFVDLTTGKALGPNQPAELWVRSPLTTIGYYNNPQATKDLIDSEGWVHTGDLCYYDENGELFVIDRLKELMKYRGIHVSPIEIETLLLTHSSVKEVVVVPIPHPTDDEHPAAFVVPLPESKVTEKELVDLVAQNMMDHFHLRGGVHFLEKLPYTPSGKISRKDMKAMAKAKAVK